MQLVERDIRNLTRVLDDLKRSVDRLEGILIDISDNDA